MYIYIQYIFNIFNDIYKEKAYINWNFVLLVFNNLTFFLLFYILYIDEEIDKPVERKKKKTNKQTNKQKEINK